MPWRDSATASERSTSRASSKQGVALTGQVAGRIDSIRPVAEIIADTVREFAEAVARLTTASRLESRFVWKGTPGRAA